ncbi:MAG: hypothetical protein PHR45_01605 [Muribaculaceae bacterium]|nr:hypothetical protein [Muribaculaceae bacterium]
MKKILIFICLLSAGYIYAGGLKVVSHYQVDAVADVYHPVTDANGEKILYTKDNYEGLKLIDLTTKEIRTISDNFTAGFCPVINGDGSVYFRSSATIDRLRNTNLMEWNSATKEVTEILPMSREQVRLQVKDNNMLIKSGNKKIGFRQGSILVYDDYNAIVVEQNGKAMRLMPVENGHTYQYATLSPNGKKILFVEPHTGIYTCNIDGSELKQYMRGDNPKWIDNETIAMIMSKDDGYIVEESRIYSLNLSTGTAIALTDNSIKVDDYTVAQLGEKIIYSTQKGELHIIEYNTEK